MVVLEKGAPHSMCLTESAKVGDTHTHTHAFTVHVK